jgi:glucokinase
MHLGIEIGGTKLQLGIGRGDGSPLASVERREVDRSSGAAGILTQIAEIGTEICRTWRIERVGIGFGGPVDYSRGRAIESHSVAGWESQPLVEWVGATLDRTAVLCQDCAVSALAEARFGAGRDVSSVLYVTVGTGVGGGFAVDGDLYLGLGPAVAEIGQMRPGLTCVTPEATVEWFCSGLGLAAHARSHLGSAPDTSEFWDGASGRRLPSGDGASRELEAACGGRTELLTGRIVSDLAVTGNAIAVHVMDAAHEALGWAIGQAVTLLGPQVVVVGGGVALQGDPAFLEAVRRQAARFVFPLMSDSYRILPAQLGESVVVQGALAIAALGRVPTYGGAPLPPVTPSTGMVAT